MKSEKNKKVLNQVSKLLVTVAPIVAHKVVSGWLLNEVEIPNCLKNKE